MQCLNCNNSVKENFCPICGQKTSTHRFSFSYIFDTGILNGIFNINKSFFFTLRELFTRPGHSIREYIQGKRIKHFNAFSLLIILMAIEYLVEDFFGGVKNSDLWPESSMSFANSLDQFIAMHPQLIYFIVIPAMAISSYIFFRRSKLNFAENILLNIYSMSALIVLGLPITLLIALFNDESIMKPLFSIYQLIAFSYAFWFFYQFFSGYKYKKINLVFRVLFSVIASNFLKIITLATIIGIKNMG